MSSVRERDDVAAEAQAQGKQFSILPKQGSITIDWIPIVDLKPDDNYSTPIWSPAAAGEGLPIEAINKEFLGAIAKFAK